MKLTKLAPALGAEVSGVDLAQPLDDARWRDIEAAWHEHSVLVFRSQTLDDLQQVAFAARFGELAHTLKDYEGGKVHPALMYVTNEKKDGKYVGALPDGEMFFHSDMCYLERPLSALLLERGRGRRAHRGPDAHDAGPDCGGHQGCLVVVLPVDQQDCGGEEQRVDDPQRAVERRAAAHLQLHEPADRDQAQRGGHVWRHRRRRIRSRIR